MPDVIAVMQSRQKRDFDLASEVAFMVTLTVAAETPVAVDLATEEVS